MYVVYIRMLTTQTRGQKEDPPEIVMEARVVNVSKASPSISTYKQAAAVAFVFRSRSPVPHLVLSQTGLPRPIRRLLRVQLRWAID